MNNAQKLIYELLIDSSESITADDVADILSKQHGNKDKDKEYLKDKWILSDTFHLMDVYVGMNDLGVTSDKTGETYSTGPIIVDDNKNMVARYGGSFGAAPEFLVLDGQNRVVNARNTTMRSTIQAYVGDRITAAVERENAKVKKVFDEVDDVINDFLSTPSMPGMKLERMKTFVSKGLMTQSELDTIRQQWKQKYSKK